MRQSGKELHRARRPVIILLTFAAGVVASLSVLEWSTALQRSIGFKKVSTTSESQADRKIKASENARTVIAMDDERIRLAQIALAAAAPGSIARSLSVPGTVVPDANRVAHVSVKLSGTVAELRKNIGDEVAKDDALGAIESREVADAKSDYLAAKLANELQQELTARDKSLWEGHAVPEQQYIKSRNAAAQTAMRFDIARQKLLALGLEEGEIAGLPQAPEATLRRQVVRAPIAGRLVERKVELGTAVGRDNLETELFVIVDLRRVWLELTVSSVDLAAVKEGQSVRITAKGIPEATGTVIFVSPLLDKDTRSARVVAALDNADGNWRPGTFVSAGIAVDQRQVQVVIPFAAVQTIDGRKAVFVRTSDGFEKRGVTLGQRDGSVVEVVAGLSPGETIAISNTFSLKAELSKPGEED